MGKLTDRPIIVRHSSSYRSHSRSRRSSISSQSSADESETHSGQKILNVHFSLDNSVPQSFFIEDLLELFRRLKIVKWKSFVKDNDGINSAVAKVGIERISGALTNAIYKVTASGMPSLLVRVFGSGAVIDRDYELEVLVRLSKNNIGAKLFGCFTNGRIEQWLEDTAPLTAELLREPQFSAMIAFRMKELHNGIVLTQEELRKGPCVWSNIDLWQQHVATFLDTNRGKEALGSEKKVFLSSFKQFCDQIAIYRNWLASKYEDYESKLVFCHNDTQYGNLLMHKGKKGNPSLVVIDFEYSGANLAAYDIANHFCEWMANYHSAEPHVLHEELYPTCEQEELFLKSYLGPNSTQKDVEALHNEVEWWRPAVSISWCLWGIVQSPIFSKNPESIEGAYEKVVNESIYKEVKTDAEIDEDVGGGDIDTFDYYAYSGNKARIFWKDMEKFGLQRSSN